MSYIRKCILYSHLLEIQLISGLFLLFISLYQMTPLHLAAQRGRYNLVGYLVGKDADVDIGDVNEVTTISADSIAAV